MSGSWTNAGSPTSGQSVIISPLSPNTEYDFEVTATNSAGSATSAPVSATTAAGVPASAPTGVTLTALTTSGAIISWTASASGDAPISYQLQYKLVSGTNAAGPTSWTNVGSSTTSTSVTVPGLTPGATYAFQVAATNAYGSAISSVYQTTLPAGTAPSTPTLSITSITPTSATLNWTASTSGTTPITYQPQYRVNGYSSWTNVGSPTSNLTVVVSGLVAATTYDFQVLAENAAGSTSSGVQTAATSSTQQPPTNPGAPVAWIITPDSISFTWPPSAGTGVLYQVQYRVNGTTAWTNYRNASIATGTTVTGLTPGTDYDFRVVASASAGTSASPILTILAPITGGFVSTASFVPNQILTAEALDAALNDKLDTTGGTVGPLQIAQTATGGGQASMLTLSRSAGGVSDAAMISGTYQAVFGDGPVVPYSGIGMTLTVTGDSSANGPAGNAWTLLGALAVNALRSTAAPANGSQHAAVVGQVNKAKPTSGIPTGRKLADGWAVYAPATDTTNISSNSSGGLAGVVAPLAANARDDAGARYGAKITYGESQLLANNGYVAEFARGIYVGASSQTAYAQVIVELGGGFSSAALDLRGAASQTGSIISSTPSAPVTALSVDKALPFASAGSPASTVSSTNPKAVTINGNSYTVVNVALNQGALSGVLTFSSPVTAADAAQGNTVIPVAHTIWLSEGGSGAQAGDIALNRAGTSRLFYDPTGGATLAAGTDPVSLLSTTGLMLPVGTSAQRPTAPKFGVIRGNSDTQSFEVWNPSTSAWSALGSGTSTGGTTSGVAPGPALALLVQSTTQTAAAISWSAPNTGSTPFQYQVQYRVSGTGSWQNWGGQQTTLSATVTGLTANTRYDFQIITSNAYGSSTSATTSATTGAVAPAVPTNLAAANETSTTVDLSWTASASGTTPISYTPQYRVTGQTAWNSAAATSGVTTTITGLTAATSYDFQIQASNTGGTSTSSIVTASTTSAAGAAPSSPTGVSATSPTANSLVVAWTAPASGTTPFSYQVQYRVTGQTAYTAFGSPVTTTSVTVTGLSASTSYDFTVTATNSAGSATSSVATGVTAASGTASSGTVTGSQNSGTTVPVVAGPASGAVQTSNVLAVTGVTITDAAAATATGSCTLVMSCTSGTLSSTIGGSAVSGSNSNSINYVNTLSACQTVAADLVYTAAGTAGSDSIVVKFTDQANNSHSISIPITVSAATTGGGGSGGTIPTDATGTQATQAQVVLNGFGVGTRIDQTNYQNLTLSSVENCINYLGGIKILRDSMTVSNDSTWFPQVAKATNTQFCAYIAQTDQANFQTYLNNWEAIPHNYIAVWEGCDEADTGQADGFNETLAQAATFQNTLYTNVQSYNLKVIQLSCGQGFATSNTGNYGTFGQPSADYGNIHYKPSGSPNYGYGIKNGIDDAQLSTPNKNAAITYFGYMQAPNSGYGSVSQATAAAYLLEFIFSAYAFGCPYYIWQSLLDDTGGTQPMGLFDNSGNPRASATAIKNLFSLMADSGSNATTFSPGKLNYTLSNFPAQSGADMTGGYQYLFQKSDGSFWLVLWNEQQINDSNGNDVAVSAVSITLTLGTQATSITVYDPCVNTSVVQSATSVTTLNISLPARPILVKVVK